MSTSNLRSVQKEYRRFAAGYDKRWAHYVRETTSLALAQLPLRANIRVLDVGCGTGTLLRRACLAVPLRTGIGIDLTLEMLRQADAHRPDRVALAQASSLALPLRNHSVDVAVSTSALHYMTSPIDVLREIGRVLVPGGTVVITDWCTDYWTMWMLDRVLRVVDPAHVACRPTADLLDLFAQAGIHVEHVARTKIDRFWGMVTVRGRT